MLADDRLRLMQALPQIGYAGIFFFDKAENFQTDRMAAYFQPFSKGIDQDIAAACVIIHTF